MDLSKLMKQAQNLQKEMAVAQKQIDALEIQGSAAANLVRITLNGKGHLISVNLDPSLPNDEVLEDLIIAAHHDATKQLEQAKSTIMGPMGGLAQQIPSFS
jgi:DNA-binding YbaB/EbfC family protein